MYICFSSSSDPDSSIFWVFRSPSSVSLCSVGCGAIRKSAYERMKPKLENKSHLLQRLPFSILGSTQDRLKILGVLFFSRFVVHQVTDAELQDLFELQGNGEQTSAESIAKSEPVLLWGTGKSDINTLKPTSSINYKFNLKCTSSDGRESLDMRVKVAVKC